MTKISKFRSVFDKQPLIDIDLKKAIDEFRTGGDYVQLIEQIRSLDEKEKIVNLKRKLPSYTFGGTFTQHNVQGLIQLSGYVQLEYDHVPDLITLRNSINSDPFTAYSGLSVSGKGAWLLVKVDNLTNAADYKEAFIQLSKRYSSYGTMDGGISDVSRLRYLSMDSDLYTNLNSSVYFFVRPPAKEESKFARSFQKQENLDWWPQFMATGNYQGIVDDRHDWLRFGMAMKQAGLPFEDYDTISSCSQGYKDTADCQKVWSESPKNVTIGTLLFFVINKAGYTIPKKEKPTYVVSGSAACTTQGNQAKKEEKTDNAKMPKYMRMEAFVIERWEFIHNVVQGCTEWREMGKNGDWNRLSDEKIDGIAHLLNRELDLSISSDRVRSFIRGHVNVNNLSHNPVISALARVPFCEDTSVFERIVDAFGVRAKNKQKCELFLRKWLCASVANINRGPNDKNNETCLILQGKQGCGKNRFVDHISAIWKRDYVVTHFGPIDTKDFLEKLHKAAIIYMDELSSLSKTTGIEEIKSVLSQSSISYRKSYGREMQEYQTCANFIGSTNDSHFLADQTGNRRFLVIEIESDFINFEKMPTVHEIWGLAKHLVINEKELCYFTPPELAIVNENNLLHSIVRDHLQILEEVIDLEDGVMIEIKPLYLKSYLNELIGKNGSPITSNRLLKDLRARYCIDSKKKRRGGITEDVITAPIAKVHSEKLLAHIGFIYNRIVEPTQTTAMATENKKNSTEGECVLDSIDVPF